MGRNQRNPQAQTQTNSKCTIPFGHPLPKTTRISDNHRLTKKRDRDRPNGTSDPQGAEGIETRIATNSPRISHKF